jgi:hypothetical protein
MRIQHSSSFQHTTVRSRSLRFTSVLDSTSQQDQNSSRHGSSLLGSKSLRASSRHGSIRTTLGSTALPDSAPQHATPPIRSRLHYTPHRLTSQQISTRLHLHNNTRQHAPRLGFISRLVTTIRARSELDYIARRATASPTTTQLGCITSHRVTNHSSSAFHFTSMHITPAHS